MATYGIVGAEISVPGTPPSITHIYPATPKTAIAVGNVFDRPFDILIQAVQGSRRYQRQITLPPLGHRAFFLDEAIRNIPDDFQGIVDISNVESPPRFFASLGIRSDGSTFSSLPSGMVARPKDYISMIWDIYLRIVNEIPYVAPDMPNPETIEMDVGFEKVINAWGSRDGIQINLALAELISDSESELAFVVGHEIGHVYQFRTSKNLFHTNRELDADVWGLILSLVSGYDPYGSAGALAKMSMALGSAGLQAQGQRHVQYLQEFLLADSGVLHGSFNERIDFLYDVIEALCTTDSLEEVCEDYKDRFHPSLPTSLSIPSRTDPKMDDLIKVLDSRDYTH